MAKTHPTAPRKASARGRRLISRAAVEAARKALRAATPGKYTTKHLVSDLFDSITEYREKGVGWKKIGAIVSEHAEVSARTLQSLYNAELAARKVAAVAAVADKIAVMLQQGKTWAQIYKALPDLAPNATRLRSLYRDAGGKPQKAAS